jgi:hypothetical protein
MRNDLGNDSKVRPRTVSVVPMKPQGGFGGRTHVSTPVSKPRRVNAQKIFSCRTRIRTRTSRDRPLHTRVKRELQPAGRISIPSCERLQTGRAADAQADSQNSGARPSLRRRTAHWPACISQWLPCILKAAPTFGAYARMGSGDSAASDSSVCWSRAASVAARCC